MSEASQIETSIKEYMNSEFAHYCHSSGIDDDHMKQLRLESSRLTSLQAELYAEFDAIWDDLWMQVQTPIQVDRYPNSSEHIINAYTGHRNVSFEGGIGRAALAFQLVQQGHRHSRLLVAYRRKIYSDDERRQSYTADELWLNRENINNRPIGSELARKIGLASIYADKFLHAEPYA